MTELTIKEMRTHPLYRWLDAVAQGETPTEQALDALKLPPSVRRQAAAVAATAAGIKAGGQHQEAWELARSRALEIVSDLPAPLQDPDYLAEPVPPVPETPDSLAADVWRW